jgi:predicted DNA-binding transcriptional regulator AlpA
MRESINTEIDLIDLAECARITSLTTRTISYYVGVGRIPSEKIGYSRMFNRRDILAWVDRREQRRQQLRELRRNDHVDYSGRCAR